MKKNFLFLLALLWCGLLQAAPVTPFQGGTGIANDNAATLTRNGAFGLTITTIGTTGVTLPMSGTLYPVGGALGTPSSGNAANLTGLPIGAITGFGTGVATGLAANVGSAGAPVLFNGAGGTPSSITLTNATGTAASLTAGTASAVAVGGITGLGAGVGTWLATPTTLPAGTTGSSLTSVGTIATGTWNATAIAANKVVAGAASSGSWDVASGGTGRATGTTAYGFIFAGTTATGAQQTLAPCATTELLVGGGASALPVCTTATGSGAPVRGTSPTFTTGATFSFLTSGRVPFAGTAGLLGDSANLLYDDTNKRLTVGSTGTSTGLILGYLGSTGVGGLWNSTLTPSTTNYALYANNVNTYINGTNSAGIAANNVTKLEAFVTAGRGVDITAGTATTDVAALSITRTNNNAAVVKGVEITYTDTTSAAGFLPLAIRGGASGVTDLLTLSKAGNLTASGTITGGGATPFTATVAGGTQIASITNSVNTGYSLWRAINNSGKNISLSIAGSLATVAGSIAQGSAYISTDSSIALAIGTFTNTPIQFFTGAASAALEQVRILDTPSASRYITLTGSNGGNPTIGVSAGSLAITPATVFASTFQSAGYTVSGLPAAGTAGRRAHVTDQLTTCAVVGAAITGGGAVTCPVFDNGTIWVGG